MGHTRPEWTEKAKDSSGLYRKGFTEVGANRVLKGE